MGEHEPAFFYTPTWGSRVHQVMPLAKRLPCGGLRSVDWNEGVRASKKTKFTWVRSWSAGSRSCDGPIEGRRVASFLNTNVDEVGTPGEDQSVRIFVRGRTIPGDGQPLGDRHGKERDKIYLDLDLIGG